MNYLKAKCKKTAALLGLLILMYVIIRLLFVFMVSTDAAQYITFTKYIWYCWKGLRFDIAGLCILNILFLLVYFFPMKFVEANWMKNILRYLFIITNAIGLLVSCADIVYYPFVQKRLQAETFMYLTGQKGNDVYNILPIFIKENWPLIILFIALMYGLIKFTNKVLNEKLLLEGNIKTYLSQTIAFLLVAGLSILGARGGFQMKPLDIIYASEMVPAEEVQYILNTPFTIAKTMDKWTLPSVHYYALKDYSICELPVHLPLEADSFKKKNVVIIIVESLSRNYISYFKGTSQTPFLDSLFQKSMVFQNSYANAKESIQGIPAVVASIPSWQDDPYIFSKYASNNIQSIASVLKPYGYASYFFHGAGKGSMGFDAFAASAGFDQYFAKEDYPDQTAFDGSWGIWDEPFLQYMSSTLKKESKPFVSVVFTLNSHHPYKIPAQYESKFMAKGHPINRAVQYTDYALKCFFDSAKKEPWFANTLFVITADHTGPNTIEQLTNKEDMSIPIVFYEYNSKLTGIENQVANQIDIFPSILDLMNYNKPFYSLGKSLFMNDCEKFSINYKSGLYHCFSKSYCYQFNGERCVGFFNMEKDPNFVHNLQMDKQYEMLKLEHEVYTKKAIQSFNQSMINNTLTFDRYIALNKIPVTNVIKLN